MQYAQRYLGAAVTGAFLMLASTTAVPAPAAPGGGHGGGGHAGAGGAHGASRGGSAHPAGVSGAARPGNGIGFGAGNGNGNGIGRANSGLGAEASGNGNGGVGNGNGNGNSKSSIANSSSATVQGSSTGTSSSGGSSTSAQGTTSSPDGGGPPQRISIAKPPVTVGDGRNGLTQVPKPIVAVSIPSAPDRFIAAAPVGPATISIQAQGNSGHPAEDRMLARIGRGALPLWVGGPPTDMRSLWFGLTGLVLMPLAGLWLGYRQARAERDVGGRHD